MSEAICLVIDTGVTASQKPEGSKSFLEASLECASLIVERRLFSESKDELAVILFGSQETNNNLEYENINVIERGLAVADWDLITFLREHVQGTNLEPDWLDGLIVALDFLKGASENKKYSALKIVLFSELGCAADSDQLDLIVQGMKMLDNVDFTHISPEWTEDEIGPEKGDNNGANNHDLSDENQPSTSSGIIRGSRRPSFPVKPQTRIQKANQDIVNELVHETEGTMVSIDCAVENFLFKSKKGKKPFPWKVCFSIGPDIRINTTGYVLNRREQPKQWKRCLARGGDEELRPETKYLRNNEEQSEVDPDEVVMGYRYGQEIVSISEGDEQNAKFDGGPKSMTLFGFLSRSEVRIQDLVGDGCMVFMPSEADGNSQRAWSALVQAMVELDVVAVVRKVYNKNSAPRLGALMPEYNEEGELFLCYVELPFAEDLRQMEFPSLPEPSEDQQDAMDDLVDVMMLCEDTTDDHGNAVNDCLNVSEMLNPNTQYLFQSLRHRALNPGRVLAPPADHITELLNCVPQEIQEAASPVLQRINQLFTTKVNENLNKRKRSQDNEDNSDEAKRSRNGTSQSQTEILEVGTSSPVEDFRYLLSHSVSSNTTFDIVAQQLDSVIMKLLSSTFGANIITKIIACLTAYREESCSRHRPELYNNLIRRVKANLGVHSKLWLEVAEANLGLIADSEVAGGSSEVEAAEFLMPPPVEESDKKNDEFLDGDSDDLLAAL